MIEVFLSLRFGGRTVLYFDLSRDFWQIGVDVLLVGVVQRVVDGVRGVDVVHREDENRMTSNRG